MKKVAIIFLCLIVVTAAADFVEDLPKKYTQLANDGRDIASQVLDEANVLVNDAIDKLGVSKDDIGKVSNSFKLIFDFAKQKDESKMENIDKSENEAIKETVQQLSVAEKCAIDYNTNQDVNDDKMKNCCKSLHFVQCLEKGYRIDNHKSFRQSLEMEGCGRIKERECAIGFTNANQRGSLIGIVNNGATNLIESFFLLLIVAAIIVF